MKVSRPLKNGYQRGSWLNDDVVADGRFIVVADDIMDGEVRGIDVYGAREQSDGQLDRRDRAI